MPDPSTVAGTDPGVLTGAISAVVSITAAALSYKLGKRGQSDSLAIKEVEQRLQANDETVRHYKDLSEGYRVELERLREDRKEDRDNAETQLKKERVEHDALLRRERIEHEELLRRRDLEHYSAMHRQTQRCEAAVTQAVDMARTALAALVDDVAKAAAEDGVDAAEVHVKADHGTLDDLQSRALHELEAGEDDTGSRA